MFRQSALTLREDRRIAFVAEPTSFMVHLVEPDSVVTHSVPASHASALIRAF
jgi:hypothetical protein